MLIGPLVELLRAVFILQLNVLLLLLVQIVRLDAVIDLLDSLQLILLFHGGELMLLLLELDAMVRISVVPILIAHVHPAGGEWLEIHERALKGRVGAEPRVSQEICLGECIHRLSVGLLFLVYQGEAEVVLQSQLLVGVLVDNGHLLALVVIVLDAVSDLGRKILEIHVALLLRVNVLQQLLYFVVAHYIGVPDCRNQILVIDVSIFINIELLEDFISLLGSAKDVVIDLL